ncbi:copper amine oxidase N-terminal domain-containing protein [Paenibacillus enshidis]|uniref:Copper amine oxidase N-terminal domain-containing protein n=1 Tax=Paenibacillus enshidis TaxID=1458439 RepID=A0ABV5B109_9BACL
MKKYMLMLLSVVLAFGVASGVAAAAEKAVVVKVNGANVVFPDGKPVMEEGRVLIPVRFVSEALGAKVDYKNRTVVIKQGETSLSLKVDSAIVTRGSERILLDVPARIKTNRVYVPLRFVSEALGAQVDWNKVKALVTITTGSASTNPDTPKTEEPEPVFKPFEWEEYTELGEALFKDNMKYKNGQVTFIVPEGTYATYNGNKQTIKLVPGKSYTYPAGVGTVTFSKIYAKEDHIENYGLSLDVNRDFLSNEFSHVKNDVVITHTIIKNGKMFSTAGTLTEVIAAAQSL